MVHHVVNDVIRVKVDKRIMKSGRYLTELLLQLSILRDQVSLLSLHYRQPTSRRIYDNGGVRLRTAVTRRAHDIRCGERNGAGVGPALKGVGEEEVELAVLI
jgi:hypothetical protein